MNIEDIRAICKKMPFTTEDIKWGHDLAYSVGGKMFCVVDLDQSPTAASFKVRDDQFDSLCQREGFKPAPYVARYNWVLVEDIRKLSMKEWNQFVRQSYELVTAKLSIKTKKQLGIQSL